LEALIQNLGRALRRTAGGSAIFVLGVGAVGSQPPHTVTSAAAALTLSDASASAPTAATAEWIYPQDERAAVMAARAFPRPLAVAVVAPAVKAKRPVATARPRAVGALAATTARPPASAVAAPPAAPVVAAPGNSAGYAFGYCTWWVSHKRLIPWHGMAAQWWTLARAYGFAEGHTPRAGAVMVMGYGMAGASASSGHVAYVESVNPNGSFLISEMNWYGSGGGFGKVDYRTITSMAGILGFIY
jgi:surface antigen